MGYNLMVIILSAGVLLLMVVLIAAKPKLAIRISGAFSVIAAVGGLMLYGYGFSATLDNLLLACVRSLISVCGMFVAAFDFSSVSDAPLFQTVWGELAYWVIHLMAFYATVSAAISTFGAGLLAKLRIRLARWEALHLIYGLDDQAMDYGKNLLAQGKGCVVYIDEDAQENLVSAAAEMGAVVRSDEQAAVASVGFLKSIGAVRGKRRISLYAFGEDRTANLEYARAMLASMKEHNITPEQTSLVIQGREDSAAVDLQVLGQRYGYGFVTVYQDAGLAARLLTLYYPPCDTITFDADGRAQQSFRAAVIGFGQLGQAVLKNLIMNGQFVGSRFHADVIAPDCDHVMGSFTSISEALLKEYSICFHAMDARSEGMYEYLRKSGPDLRYLVICTGSEKDNREIAEDLTLFLERHNMTVPVFRCSYQGISAYDAVSKTWCTRELYQPENLDARAMDEMAMVINHYYQGDGGISPVQDWMKCDFFSRMSSRASADFADAMVKISGRTREQVQKHGWDVSGTMLENLSITEHLRWCAFHYCMGFAAMTQEEYAARAARYLAQVEAGEKPLRIGKNMDGRTHACLIPWEELDTLSEKESGITGKTVNYKAMDTDNVLAVPKLLALRESLSNI